MRIGYFADGPWSHQAIELIANDSSFEIAFIVPRYDTQDPVLKNWADKLNVPFLPYPNVNDPKFIGQLGEYRADIFVSMSFNQILKSEIINHPPKGFINCHAGALPFYRGRNPLNWVLINGESSFGITTHYIDEGIDTGDIIEQRLYPIQKTDNYGSLLTKAIEECAAVLHSALTKINTEKLEVIKQVNIHPVGTYFGMRQVGDEMIDFTWSSERVHNFVRGITRPGPCARFYKGSDEYAILETCLIENAPNYIATVGEVIGRDDGNVVKTGNNTIKLKRIAKVVDGMVQDPYIPNFPIGTRLTANAEAS